MDKERRKYKKLCNKYQKSLVKIARDTWPTDYGFGLQMVIEFLKFMRDYYKEGLNIGLDGERQIPRLASINMCLQYYDSWSNCDDDFFIIVPKAEVEKYQRLGWYIPIEHQDNRVLMDSDSRYATMTKYQSFGETNKFYEIACAKRKALFFDYLCRHIEEWWD